VAPRPDPRNEEWNGNVEVFNAISYAAAQSMEKGVRVGQLIAGKYRVEKTIGRGGMGVVMSALHEQLEQRVALKFLTDDAYQQPEAVARFVREARAAVQIQSVHGARVMDVGTLDDGAPYMVMEYLRGSDLKQVSHQRGPLPVSEAVDYVLQACDAVAEAHSLGIVHRDLKPANLFLTRRPDGSPLVKVLDFGISKSLLPGDRSSQMQMTASAAIMGSPQYMSPEQIRSSKNVDARTDIWALGTILHELLTGSPAYEADTVPGLLAMIVADPPAPLGALRPDMPPGLEAIVLRCMQKNREQRFSSIADLAWALERFASDETRPLARRIAGSRAHEPLAEASLAAPPPFGWGPSNPGGQTRGTWEHADRQQEDTPFHLRLGVQLGAAVVLLGVGLLIWLFAMQSAEVSEEQAQEAIVPPAPKAALNPIPEAAPMAAPPWVPPPAPVLAPPPAVAPVDVEEAREEPRPRTKSSPSPKAKSTPASSSNRLRSIVGRPPLGSEEAANKGAAGKDSKKGDPMDLFNDTK
jgi:serine/threonine-protein kinase